MLRNPISRRSPDEIPGECGSLPVGGRIVNAVNTLAVNASCHRVVVQFPSYRELWK